MSLKDRSLLYFINISYKKNPHRRSVLHNVWVYLHTYIHNVICLMFEVILTCALPSLYNEYVKINSHDSQEKKIR